MLVGFLIPTISLARCGEPSRFVLRKGEATDTAAGLVWQRCSVGLEWRDGKGCVGELRSMSLNEATKLAAQAGDGWRLPNADELLGLIERDCGSPAIDRKAFPDVSVDSAGEGSLYWSSTNSGMLDMIVTVDFAEGYYDVHSKGMSYFVRLVKTEKK